MELVVEHLGAPATSVGLGIPGLVDVERGAVKHAVNLGVDGEWVPLRAELEARLGVPVAVENDVNVATLGAVALTGIRDLVYLSIGTGLAAGLVLDGRLRRGATGAAGEIGHVPIDPLGAACQCGQRGCLETVASGRALAEAWPSGDQPPAQALFAAATAGDPRAIEVRDRFAAGVADAVRTLCLTVDPTTIVLGGGVSHLGAPLVAAVSGRAARPGRLLAVPRLARPGRAGSGWSRTTSRSRRSGPHCWGGCPSGSSPARLRRRGGRARRGRRRGAGPLAPVGRAGAGHRVVPRRDLRRAGRAAPGRHRSVVRPGAGVPARRVRRPAGRAPAVLPRHHRPRAHRRPRPARRPRARARPDRRADGRCGLRGAAAEAGGVDLQLLGIGTDGHLAFNEPGSSLASRTRIKTLTEQTRRDNARFFGSLDEVPHHVLTQGLGTILHARHLLLIATGAGKADAVAAAVEGPLTASCPASVLQLHPHATVLLDPEAASLLERADHYREVYASKPDWQGL